MQVCRDNDRNKVGMCLLNHLTVIRIACNMKPAHSTLQVRFVRFRYPHELNLLLVEIPEYPQVVHSHRACTDHCNSHSHRATTSLAIVERSSSLTAGCTGSDNTCCAALSVAGRCAAGLPPFRGDLLPGL